MDQPTDTKTSFGYRTVTAGQKPHLVRQVFRSVSPRYDIMNDAMSLGIHRLWKLALVDWLAPRNGRRFLDLAGGTGDVARSILERAPEAEILVVDLTEDMLVEGQRKSMRGPSAGRIGWVAGDAQRLPFADGSFDCCTISFGLRNFVSIDESLAEIRRVLRTGGRLLVLEFSQVPNEALRWLYDRYSFKAIPTMGRVIANDRDSYQYLVESIRRFPDQESLAALMSDCGYDRVSYRNLSMGIAALHSGWKL
ncbi:MAG: bifunctional demethylmenaquinone methyltransferase/2-methoxy-6-polyprenyl-1,4-benzoquinol methylase UbiE [Rhodobacteraceae bacterium]|nr:bifunctional demethylmenaquinone methyltransferase/2-methoxy-6-polyprenyl-1,4-benzoquinol methylase UbiE [Paracoccaceae bacterium]